MCVTQVRFCVTSPRGLGQNLLPQLRVCSKTVLPTTSPSCGMESPPHGFGCWPLALVSMPTTQRVYASTLAVPIMKNEAMSRRNLRNYNSHLLQTHHPDSFVCLGLKTIYGSIGFPGPTWVWSVPKRGTPKEGDTCRNQQPKSRLSIVDA